MADRPKGGTALFLTQQEYAELVATLIALRRLGDELSEAFSGSSQRAADDASRGAQAIVASVDRLLDIVGYPAKG